MQKKSDCKKEICDLFSKYIKDEEVLIDDVYHIGSKNPRPVVITFSSAAYKESLFQSKSRLKKASEELEMDIYVARFISAFGVFCLES